MLKKLCILIFVSFTAKLINANIHLWYNVGGAKHEDYEGYGVYDIQVHSPKQITALKSLKQKLNLDIWLFPSIARHGKVFVPPNLKKHFQTALENIGIKYSLEVDNIKQQIDLENALLSAANKKSNRIRKSDLSFNQIHTFKVVSHYLDKLAKNHPDLVSVASAGKSFQGRDMKYIKISTTKFEDTSKPVVFIQSLLHAREWITLPVSLYAIKKLIHDVTDQELQQNLDWIILPVANPDGYVYSHKYGRLWRKNCRRRNDTWGCMGVDLNRNFDVNWGTESSDDYCAQDFHGEGPFSEPESVAIRNIFHKYHNQIELFLDIHSAGSMILYAYGDGTLPANALQLHVLGVLQAQAIDAVKWPVHPNYTVGNCAWAIGHPFSGVSFDYAQKIGIPYPYIYELPVNSNYNRHLVNPEFIEQAGFETWQGIKAAAFAVLDKRKIEVRKRPR